MSSFHRKPSARRRLGLGLERLEERALLSYAGLYAAHTSQATHAAFATLLASAANTGAPAVPTTPQPTPKELARERFVAKLVGTYGTGQGRFTDQAFQVAILASGGSNQSLHFNLNMLFFFPKDTTQPVTGVALLSAKNVTSAGNAIGLTLTADAQQPGFHGLPTQFTWTVAGNSGGTYSGSTGQGTLTIRYYPNGRGPLHGIGAGQIALAFQGLINTTGVNNVLATLGNRP